MDALEKYFAGSILQEDSTRLDLRTRKREDNAKVDFKVIRRWNFIIPYYILFCV